MMIVISCLKVDPTNSSHNKTVLILVRRLTFRSILCVCHLHRKTNLVKMSSGMQRDTEIRIVSSYHQCKFTVTIIMCAN
jgi:hypothetical protein